MPGGCVGCMQACLLPEAVYVAIFAKKMSTFAEMAALSCAMSVTTVSEAEARLQHSYRAAWALPTFTVCSSLAKALVSFSERGCGGAIALPPALTRRPMDFLHIKRFKM